MEKTNKTATKLKMKINKIRIQVLYQMTNKTKLVSILYSYHSDQTTLSQKYTHETMEQYSQQR